jgi:hypothetical protein
MSLTTTITIYGASDDLIEVEGSIEEEFGCRGGENEGDLLAFSDGTILRVAYTAAGIWRITPVFRGNADLMIEQAPEGDDSNYSDRATLSNLSSPMTWVVQGIAFAARPA